MDLRHSVIDLSLGHPVMDLRHSVIELSYDHVAK